MVGPSYFVRNGAWTLDVEYCNGKIVKLTAQVNFTQYGVHLIYRDYPKYLIYLINVD